MACGRCGGRRAAAPPSTSSLRTGYTPSPGQNGVYTLATYPDCQEPYNGDHWRSDVFVVGLGVEGETLFRRDQSSQAVAHARSTKLRLHRLPANTLCAAAMTDLYGS